MKVWLQRLKRRARPAKNMAQAISGSWYDYVRFIKYGGWRLSNSDSSVRNYLAVKVYHRLEKSLSFRNRRAGSGWDALHELLGIVKAAGAAGSRGFQDKVAVNVLRTFVDESPALAPTPATESALIYIDSLPAYPEVGGGYSELTSSSLLSGQLDSPERFFYSRHSVRDYSSRPVAREQILRAVELASKSPSVCSRQAWHVYEISDREKIDRALKYQNGNKGFGHEVPCLLIVTADLRAFDAGYERNQPWIDGGMFAMSLVYALHSLGLASCCLNWSRTPTQDRAFRSEVPISAEHSVIMMIACGYPNDEFRGCASARRPVSEIHTRL